MGKRAIVQKPRRKLARQKPGHGVEHVRLKVRRDGSEEISVFGPDVEDTVDQQTYAQRKNQVYDEQSKTLSKKPDQAQG